MTAQNSVKTFVELFSLSHYLSLQFSAVFSL